MSEALAETIDSLRIHQQDENENSGFYKNNEIENSYFDESSIKEESLIAPGKKRFVRSNGSPYGSRGHSERSIIGPSLSPIMGSDEEDIEVEGDASVMTHKSQSSAGKPTLPKSASVGSSFVKHEPDNGQNDSDSDSPFDHLNEVLAKGQVATSSPILSDHNSAFLSFNNDTIVGFRAREANQRKLETENLELRMKLQQFREMATGENEMLKMKHELVRAESRIDELELALERKNRVIEQLTNDKDLLTREREDERKKADGLYSDIEELQNLISQLEEVDQKVLQRSHKEFPDILPENPEVKDLLNALRNTVEENQNLTKVSNLASSLKAQNTQIMAAIKDSGRKGDPVNIIREFSADVSNLRLREQELLNELEKLESDHREMEGMVGRLEETSREAKSNSYHLIQSFFAELFEYMGDDFQEKVELELKQIVERSIKNSVSKIPPLTDLMVSYTRQIAEMASNRGRSSDDILKIQMLEEQNQSLEHMIEMKMDKLKADAVLRAQIRDLQRQVKKLNELRQTEWNEYQRFRNSTE